MRFAVVTLGSAGDLHPFLAIARALAERGHEVHVLTQAPYESEVRAEGVGFMSIATQAEHERTLDHPRLWHPLHGFGVLWRHLAVPAIGPTIAALETLSRNGRLIVLASPLAAGARLARERWPERIRLLSGYTAPMGLRSIADPMFLGGWRVPRWLPPAVRRLGWAALDQWKLEPMAAPVLRQWAERLGMRPLMASLFGDTLHSPDGGLALYPCWFAPVPPAWAERGVRQTGFPVFEPSASPALPAAVSAFIADPRPFVVVYPGSAARHIGSLAERSLAACRALGLRALVLSRSRSQDAASGPDALHADLAPLGRVLPAASAFVHHGGVGSAAQALAARTPQLVLASAYDQFENGARIQRLHQGQWQRAARASARSIGNALDALRARGRSPALMLPPRASWPGDPNPHVEEACEILEGMAEQP